MVAVIYKGRIVGHKPPYTEEEDFAFYRAMSYKGGMTVIHAPRPPAEPLQPPQSAPPLPGKK
jgi:hypothetical protein